MCRSKLNARPSMDRLLQCLIVLAMGVVPAVAFAYDYPTVDRVEYVHTCMRDNPGQAQEMLYKCSCTIDAISKQMTYEDFVESSTAAYAYTIGGERGETVRAYTPAKQMADHFREVQAQAKKSCFIR
jgi:hypothetical protein